jgi:hypothetical protein
LDANKIWVTDHTVPSGTDSDVDPSQAFHAWLPSCGPYGTKVMFPYVDAHAQERDPP